MYIITLSQYENNDHTCGKNVMVRPLCATKFDVGLPSRQIVGMQSSKNIVACPQTAVPLLMALINKLGEVPHSVEACYLTSDVK